MTTFKQIRHYMGKKRLLLPISLVLSGLNGLLSLVPFVFIWMIVRELLGSGGIGGSRIYAYAWWAAGLAAAGVAVYFAALALSHLAAFRVEVNLRKEAMERIVRMPLGFFNDNLSGKMRKVIDEDSSQTHTFIAHILPDIAGSIMGPAGIIIMIFLFDWRMGIVCLIPIFAAMSTMGLMLSPKRNRFQRLYLDAQEKMSSEAVEYVRGIPVVKVFQQTVFSFKRFYDSIMEYRNLVVKHTLMWRFPMSLYTLAINSFAFLLVPAAILLIRAGGDIPGVIADMFLYLLIAPLLAANIMKLAYLGQNLFLLRESMDRIGKLTSTEPLAETEAPKSPESHEVCFENVSFRYPGSDRDAVSNITLSIPEGKTFALVGASGSGKTTIARLLPRFWDPTEGCIRIGGIDVRDIGKAELMDRISFVFQNTKLFKTSIRENIVYGASEVSEEAIERAIDISRSREIIDRLPGGLDTVIGAEGTYLSGGEQQRIALARAILKDAPIVVLDEATAFSDPENEHLIQDALRKLMKGKTVLMIAHRLSSIRNVDRILVMDKGRIAEEGTHRELLELDGRYNSMWKEYLRSVEWTVQ